MHLKINLKYIYLLFCLAFCSFRAASQQFSYVYIQGDKQIPFYVKLEDEMQPRYGKNHCIISQLAPGPIHIQVLFQQNMFPPQKFTIMVPENGFRGFLLTKKGAGFSLYDIQQGFYLAGGDNADDDHVPINNTAANYVPAGIADVSKESTATEPPIRKAITKRTPIKKAQVVAKTNEPQFIDNLELNNERTVQNNPVSDATDDIGNNISAKNKRGIVNSDCPEPMSDNTFDDIYNRLQKHSDNAKLKYLLSKLDNCYNTSQIRILTKELNNDPERYQFLKQVYPRVTDQSNFPLLESLLSTQEWKSYFLLIIP